MNSVGERMDNIILKTSQLKFMNIEYEDIEIKDNEVTFIVGKSGTGKSSLLKIFNQTYSQTSGKVFYNGKDIDDLNAIDLRKEILLISQNVFLFDDTIKGNFKSFYEFRGEEVISDEEIKKFLSICCIDFSIDESCITMSGGERQRIYTAIFLSFKPKVLMLDEPTSALDSINSKAMLKNIIDFCKDNSITLIIVSHDNELTNEFAENIITIQKAVQ